MNRYFIAKKLYAKGELKSMGCVEKDSKKKNDETKKVGKKKTKKREEFDRVRPPFL